jgi:hypothetical protein
MSPSYVCTSREARILFCNRISPGWLWAADMSISKVGSVISSEGCVPNEYARRLYLQVRGIQYQALVIVLPLS